MTESLTACLRHVEKWIAAIGQNVISSHRTCTCMLFLLNHCYFWQIWLLIYVFLIYWVLVHILTFSFYNVQQCFLVHFLYCYAYEYLRRVYRYNFILFQNWRFRKNNNPGVNIKHYTDKRSQKVLVQCVEIVLKLYCIIMYHFQQWFGFCSVLFNL